MILEYDLTFYRVGPTEQSARRRPSTKTCHMSLSSFGKIFEYGSVTHIGPTLDNNGPWSHLSIQCADFQTEIGFFSRVRLQGIKINQD